MWPLEVSNPESGYNPVDLCFLDKSVILVFLSEILKNLLAQL